MTNLRNEPSGDVFIQNSMTRVTIEVDLQDKNH